METHSYDDYKIFDDFKKKCRSHLFSGTADPLHSDRINGYKTAFQSITAACNVAKKPRHDEDKVNSEFVVLNYKPMWEIFMRTLIDPELIDKVLQNIHQNQYFEDIYHFLKRRLRQILLLHKNIETENNLRYEERIKLHRCRIVSIVAIQMDTQTSLSHAEVLSSIIRHERSYARLVMYTEACFWQIYYRVAKRVGYPGKQSRAVFHVLHTMMNCLMTIIPKVEYEPHGIVTKRINDILALVPTDLPVGVCRYCGKIRKETCDSENRSHEILMNNFYCNFILKEME